MIKSIIFLKGEDDDAGAVFNTESRELIKTIDTYHGEEVNEALLKSLGVEVHSLYHSDLISEDEYEPSSTTCTPANFDLIKERIKTYNL